MTRIAGPIAPQPRLPTLDEAPTPQRHAQNRAPDELSTGQGRALRDWAERQRPPPPATYTVVAGDSWYRIAQNEITAQLAAQGLSPSDPSYSATWHRLVVQRVHELQAANGHRALHPGDVLLLPSAGAAPTPTPTPAPVPPGPNHVPPAGDYAAAFINQFASDPDGRNGNCGFTSALMAMRLLGLDTSQLGGNTYEQAMRLRQLSGASTYDRDFVGPSNVVNALTAVGAHAAIVPNTWGPDKLAAVDVMRQAFLSGQRTAFVVAGNPTLGWPNQTTYSGGHFVTVAGYDPATDTFTVLDPFIGGPIQVTAQQLASYLTDGNSESGELVQVTPP